MIGRQSRSSLALETLLRRDRAIAAVALGLIVVLAAVYTIIGPGMKLAMSGDLGGAIMVPGVWSPAYAALMVLMWWIMMVAMMLPSAAPMILLVVAVARRQSGGASPHAPVAAFVGGYLVAWGGFGLAATALQWAVEAAGLLSPMWMASTSRTFAGIVLVAAGLYQLTPLKRACLGRCRDPLAFVARHWRPGTAGAFRMGVVHGAWCLGCCWALMLLLFVGGVMNPVWIAGLAVYVLIEKVVPQGQRIGILAGVLLTGWGTAMLLGLV